MDARLREGGGLGSSPSVLQGSENRMAVRHSYRENSPLIESANS